MKEVLFVCVENSCRSQMAEALFNRQVDPQQARGRSAGSRPGEAVNPAAVQIMKEKGLDISAKKPKGFSALDKEHFDYVITLGCRDVCPFVPAEKHVEWQIPDPKGKDLDFFREVCRMIEDKIEIFIKERLRDL